jgi:hypothetical protein
MGEIEDILASLKAEYGGKTDASPTPSPATEYGKKTTPSPVTDPILEELRREYRGKEREEQIRAEKQRASREERKRAALERKAREWLAKLDRSSDEGRWFEEFAYSHESPLEAAMIYLDALRESERF